MTDFREFYTEGYSLPDRHEAERMGNLDSSTKKRGAR